MPNPDGQIQLIRNTLRYPTGSTRKTICIIETWPPNVWNVIIC